MTEEAIGSLATLCDSNEARDLLRLWSTLEPSAPLPLATFNTSIFDKLAKYGWACTTEGAWLELLDMLKNGSIITSDAEKNTITLTDPSKLASVLDKLFPTDDIKVSTSLVAVKFLSDGLPSQYEQCSKYQLSKLLRPHCARLIEQVEQSSFRDTIIITDKEAWIVLLARSSLDTAHNLAVYSPVRERIEQLHEIVKSGPTLSQNTLALIEDLSGLTGAFEGDIDFSASAWARSREIKKNPSNGFSKDELYWTLASSIMVESVAGGKHVLNEICALLDVTLLDLPKLPITNDLEAVSLLRVLTFANDNQILQDQSIPEVCAQHCARIYGPPSVHYASADARLKALVHTPSKSNIPEIEQILSFVSQELGDDCPIALNAAFILALHQILSAHSNAAFMLAEDMHAKALKRFGPKSTVAMTYGHYASTIYYIGGSWDRAIQKHNEIQAIILEAYGAESQISAAYFKHKAALYFDAQEIEEGLDAVRTVAKMVPKVFSPTGPAFHQMLCWCGNQFLAQAKYSEAADVYTLVFERARPNSWQYDEVCSNLVESLVKCGKYEKARPILEPHLAELKRLVNVDTSAGNKSANLVYALSKALLYMAIIQGETGSGWIEANETFDAAYCLLLEAYPDAIASTTGSLPGVALDHLLYGAMIRVKGGNLDGALQYRTLALAQVKENKNIAHIMEEVTRLCNQHIQRSLFILSVIRGVGIAAVGLTVGACAAGLLWFWRRRSKQE